MPLAEFQRPATPAQQAATKRLHAFRRLFQGDAPAPTPAKGEADLRSLPAERLADLAPPIDWQDAAAALDRSVGAWAHSEAAAGGLRFLVNPPFGGHAETVRAWAAVHGWTVLSPPSSEQILSGDPAWLGDVGLPRDRWVLPSLERCFLRQSEGLGLVRRFLELAVGNRLGRGLIGCDSWAWVFLQRVWTVPQPEVLTLQAFDGSALSVYFRLTLHGRVGPGPRVRNVKTGEDLFPDQGMAADTNGEASSELKRLAAHCCGNLGIAWYYWRSGFRTEPDSSAPTESLAGTPAAALVGALDNSESTVAQAPTLWWTAQRDEPATSHVTDDETIHVLHALLLHNGLSDGLIAEVLPSSRVGSSAILHRLERLRLIERADDRWRVAARSYEAVRGLLRSRGYLIDGF